MANKDLSKKPHIVTGNGIWWYEEPGGIEVYIETLGFQVKHFTISWRAIRGALKRKDKGKDDGNSP